MIRAMRPGRNIVPALLGPPPKDGLRVGRPHRTALRQWNLVNFGETKPLYKSDMFASGAGFNDILCRAPLRDLTA